MKKTMTKDQLIKAVKDMYYENLIFDAQEYPRRSSEIEYIVEFGFKGVKNMFLQELLDVYNDELNPDGDEIEIIEG